MNKLAFEIGYMHKQAADVEPLGGPRLLGRKTSPALRRASKNTLPLGNMSTSHYPYEPDLRFFPSQEEPGKALQQPLWERLRGDARREATWQKNPRVRRAVLMHLNSGGYQ